MIEMKVYFSQGIQTLDKFILNLIIRVIIVKLLIVAYRAVFLLKIEDMKAKIFNSFINYKSRSYNYLFGDGKETF